MCTEHQLIIGEQQQSDVVLPDSGGDPREQRNPPFAQNVRIAIYSYVSPILVDLLM